MVKPPRKGGSELKIEGSPILIRPASERTGMCPTDLAEHLITDMHKLAMNRHGFDREEELDGLDGLQLLEDSLEA